MTTLVATLALPVSAAVIFVLLRTRVARVMVKAPAGERWRMDSTPFLGGLGIFAGLLAGVAAALAAGAIEPDAKLWGILGGCAIVFLAGLVDDLRHLGPLAKLVAQFAAAVLVLATGTSVELVGNPVAATALALVWLVGMTNAFNLLDNMDGLAATLAGIAAAFFAIDAVTIHPSHTHLVLALAIALACAGFLPFNLRPGRRAAVFMGDSGSQTIGFALAALGLSASWNVAGTTVATLALPVLILAVPILDTALVTVARLLEGRPVSQGGRDHSSHRLVRYGLSETSAVMLLALVAVGLGGTSLAYNVLDNQRITLVGVLLTFVVLIQFAGFLADVERRPSDDARSGVLQAFDVHWRRLIEVVVDFCLIVGSFLAAYLIRYEGFATAQQRHAFMVTVPVLVTARYLAFIPSGLYRSVWRYAGARDLAAVVGAVAVSEAVATVFVWQTQSGGLSGFSRDVFVLDFLICTMLIGGSRLGERLLVRFAAGRDRATARRTLIVGAGRSGRSLHRELRETAGERVVGFVDDNPRLRRRRLQGRPVYGSLGELAVVLSRARPDRVLVTIPDAPAERLELVVSACAEGDVPCAFVRREIEHEPPLAASAAAE
ncbi:MAG TPA: hypothetical protein VFI37_01730 [Gaiellaceae bacterium]|nr:hypothetical protein [Gaiellaceae bacterium]